MRYKCLWTFDNPGEITDAELVGLLERRGEGEASRITKRAGKSRGAKRGLRLQALLPQTLGYREIKTEQLATILAHTNILTRV